MRRWSGRAFALGGLAAGLAAALVAVLAALAAPTTTLPRTQAAAATTGAPRIGATEIRYTRSANAVRGVAGSSVRAVIVKLTKKGTVWATLHDGAFVAAVPDGYRVLAVVKVLAGGRRQTFRVR